MITIRDIRLNTSLIDLLAAANMMPANLQPDMPYSSVMRLEHWVRLEVGNEDNDLTVDQNFWWLGVCFNPHVPTTTQFTLPPRG